MDRDDILNREAQLDNLGIDLGNPEPADPPRWMRKQLVDELARCLVGPKVNPVLIGAPGVGKTTAVGALALAMAAPRRQLVPRSLHKRRIIQVSAPDIVSGALYANQLEHKIRAIARNFRHEGAFLFLDNVASFIGAGASSSDPEGDIASMISPYVQRGDVRVIATASPADWTHVTRSAPVFARLLTPVVVPEVAADELSQILSVLTPHWSRQYGVEITDDALSEAIDLASRLFPWKKAPGNVCDLVEPALALASARGPARNDQIEVAKKMGWPVLPVRVGRTKLASAVQQLTGLPRFVIVPSEPAPRKDLSTFFRDRVFGQEHVVSSLVDRIQMIKARMCAPARPLGTFLLAGPTGVGKTLVARTIAELLLGDPDRLIRFDMSEFSTSDSVARFVGENHSRRGGIGLVDAALAAPFPVILLDEIEKAHRSLFDVLLQVLGEGRLTDHAGRTAHFTNALILMTSNLGSGRRRIDHPRALSAEASWRHRVNEAVRRHFRPELINRITEIFAFQPLDRTAIESVARRELRHLVNRRGLTARSVTVQVSRDVLQAVLRAGHSMEYGVRPMERAVDRLVGTPIARFLAERPNARRLRLTVDVAAGAHPTIARVSPPTRKEIPHVA